MEGVMIRKVTGFLFLLCLVPGLMWGATDGKKYQDPVVMNPDTSAPDAWGYTWVRSTDPGGPTFNWVDITTRGTPAPILPTPGGLGDDNSVGPYPILFQFPYYWYTVSNFRIGSNGYVTFGNQAANFANPFTALPNTSIPNDMLAICAGDLDFTVAAALPQCFYWSNGVDSLVISFINVTEWQPAPANPNLKHTFQVILRKADSSITYQYGVQQGQYNSSANNLQLSIGMENQTGQIGLNYTFSTTTVGVPHPGMPTNGLAVKYKRTVNTGLAITDGGIVGGFNDGNLAKVVRVGVAEQIKGIVKNFGTVPLTNVPVRYAITRAGQPSAFDTVIVSSLQPSEQVTVTFPRLFTPAVVGAYSALFNVTVPGDVGPGNNSRTAELVSASFAVGQPTRVQFENGTVGGSINWTGGGGMGVAIDLPVYPVRVETVFVQVGAVTTNPMTVEILDGSSGSPGTVLATRVVTAAAGMNTVDFISSNVMIAGGRFFIGARGLMSFSYETTAPISFRTWEFTNGWAPYRSGDLQDVIIRASVRPVTPPGITYNVPEILYYKFEDNPSSSLVTNFAVPGQGTNPAPLANGVTPFGAGGQFDTCIVGTGVANGGVTTGWNLSLANRSWTIGMWVEIPTNATGSALYLFGDAAQAFRCFHNGVALPNNLVLRGTGVIDVTVTGIGPTPTYVHFVYDSATAVIRAFKNGVLANTVSQTPFNFTVGTGFRAGGYGASLTFSGKVDEFRVYSRALDTTEVRNTWNRTLPATVTDVREISNELPAGFALAQNYPNPFNPTTSIQFSLPTAANVTLKIYNILGQEVATLVNEQRGAGTFEAVWNGRNSAGNQMASGMYFYNLIATSTDGKNTFTNVKKMLLLK
ncbi:MAG: hypothetical protein HW412_1061 [Bacteroidetes bacterium]|nr:hypothetical protein [Bacteroidota bacterium]